MVVSCGGDFRGQPRGRVARLYAAKPRGAALRGNHNFGRRNVCIWWCPVEAIFAANRVAAWRGFTRRNRVAQLYAATTILAGEPSAYGGGLLRPFSRPAAWPRGAALRGETAWRSFTRQPQFWPAERLHMVVSCGGHFRGQPRGRVARLYAAPGLFRVPFWPKKWLNPFKMGSFCVSKIVQKKFKKKLTPPCSFEILSSHTVTTKQKHRKQYEN
jgi:hypothetical protein